MMLSDIKYFVTTGEMFDLIFGYTNETNKKYSQIISNVPGEDIHIDFSKYLNLKHFRKLIYCENEKELC